MDNFIAGYLGGMLGTFAAYPIDTLRIRLQSGIKSNKGILSGVASPAIGIGIEKAVVFGVYNNTYKYTKNDFISGLNSGLFASMVVTPVEKYKILKQNDPKLTYSSITNNIFKKGTINGIKTLYNGLSACFFREIPGYAIYFTTYNYLNKITNNINNDKFSYINFSKTLINGGLSGVSAWIMIYPFDTIKTNMQQNDTNFIDTTKKLLNEGRLYKGISWSLMRAFTLHSCVFIGYEISKYTFNNI